MTYWKWREVELIAMGLLLPLTWGDGEIVVQVWYNLHGDEIVAVNEGLPAVLMLNLLTRRDG